MPSTSTATPSALSDALGRAAPRMPPWPVALGFVAVFLLFDWVSYIRPLQGLNITPWNPQPALAIALLLRNPRWLWLVGLSLLAAEVVVRGLPGDWLTALGASGALALTYAAMARAVALRLDASLALATRRDLLWFSLIAVLGTLVNGLAYVSVYALAGQGPDAPFVEAVGRYWVGEAVGVLVMLPMLLVLTDARRRVALLATLRGAQWWLMAALIALLLWAVFSRPNSEPFKFFYLLLLPVVWASARLGVAGAVLAAGWTQIGLIVAVQSVLNPDLTVFELQVLMAVITMTGLLLGVAVDEQARAAAELRGSLRLAAAGQMASALAHELSQPLTALSSYAQAARMLIGAPGVDEARRLAQLSEVTQRMVDDAHRASEVVKRLREFFRTGTTQLRETALAPLVDEAVQTQARRAQLLGLSIATQLAPGLPAAWMDPVQIGVVLRNLLANAVDAASAAGAPARVELRASVDGRALLVEVRDSGAGVDPARVHSVFDAGASDKPGGMGVGLSICRAIVEAHGGRLWAQPGPGGRFCFTLPTETSPPKDAVHAP